MDIHSAKARSFSSSAGAASRRASKYFSLSAGKDPGEATNLAEREPERVAAMRAKLEELLKDAVPSGADAAGAEE